MELRKLDEQEKALVCEKLEDFLLRTGKPIEPCFLFENLKNEENGIDFELQGTDALSVIKADKRFRHSYEGGIYLSSEVESRNRRQHESIIDSIQYMLGFFSDPYSEDYSKVQISEKRESLEKAMKSLRGEIKKTYRTCIDLL